MPKPIAICVEDTAAADAAGRYLRCVALPGRQPGLRIDAGGQVRWRGEDSAPCELWVSADDKLILFRPDGGPAVRVSRAGRSLDVPHGKPVVLRSGDELAVGDRRLRVHLHGQTATVAAPSPLPPAERSGTLRRASAAVAMGAALGAAATLAPSCGGSNTGTQTPDPEPADASVAPEPDAEEPDIEMRYQPPAPPQDYMLYTEGTEPTEPSTDEK
ncbi:MAG: hypothetical protein HY905_09420 [Deltaproteobacteria bacterium]|nr:hypothetical protein [Deltaproteobacteria bacterium]